MARCEVIYNYIDGGNQSWAGRKIFLSKAKAIKYAKSNRLLGSRDVSDIRVVVLNVSSKVREIIEIERDCFVD